MKQIKPKNNTAKTILKKRHYSGKRDFKELEMIKTLPATYVNMMWKNTSSNCQSRWQLSGTSKPFTVEMYEAGEDVDKPDEITTGKWGKVWYDCYACKGSMLQWVEKSHFSLKVEQWNLFRKVENKNFLTFWLFANSLLVFVIIVFARIASLAFLLVTRSY